jgi:hypothetical protein
MKGGEKVKKLYILFILLLSLATFTGCNDSKIYEDFIYLANKTGTTEYVSIIGFSEQGKIRKEITFPEYIKDIPVLEIGHVNFKNQMGDFESDNLEIIYLTKQFDFPVKDMFYKCPNLKKMIFLPDQEFVFDEYKHLSQAINMNETIRYIHIIGNSSQSEVVVDEDSLYWEANVVFNFNADGKIYFFDFYDGTVIEYIPQSPIRKGYIFLGWYKEKECIHEWNFENEVIPALIFDSKTQKYKYNKTMLYAKWEII